MAVDATTILHLPYCKVVNRYGNQLAYVDRLPVGSGFNPRVNTAVFQPAVFQPE